MSLPAQFAPQLLFALGVCWFLAALGAFVRDLVQLIGFILTLWFFITPICYPEQSIPPAAIAILKWNPLFALVRAYRAIFLEGHAPAARPLVAALVFSLGHASFNKLSKAFADVI